LASLHTEKVYRLKRRSPIPAQKNSNILILSREDYSLALLFIPLGNLPTGLYILLALISLFFVKFENNYPRICWTDFYNFFLPNDRYLRECDSSRDVAKATDFMAKFGYAHLFGRAAFENGCNIAILIQKYLVAIY